jgi:hypothetical protein
MKSVSNFEDRIRRRAYEIYEQRKGVGVLSATQKL